MTSDAFYDAFWLGSGTIIIGLGAASSALGAFRGDFVSTYAGILLFIFGYKLSWYGVHRDHQDRLQQQIERLGDPTVGDLAMQVSMFVIGGLGIALGLYLFARTSTGGGSLTGITAGIVSILGYVIAHRQLNASLV